MGSDELRERVALFLEDAYAGIDPDVEPRHAPAAEGIQTLFAPLLAEKDATIELGRTEHVEFREYVLRDQQIMGALAERLTAEREVPPVTEPDPAATDTRTTVQRGRDT